MSELQIVLERLDRIESAMTALVDRQRVQEFYDIETFAKIVGRSCFTCREWARHGRINAQKRPSGRGKYQSWVVEHSELLRYHREGLLPLLG